jgi:crotonobetainyl-CoA:carnitine CoA-transferase CaiB-like acyl-CoA transferase
VHVVIERDGASARRAVEGVERHAATIGDDGAQEQFSFGHVDEAREAHADAHRKEEFEGEIWLPWLLERTMKQVVDECQAHESLAAPINTIADAMDNNPQAEAREYFVRVDHPQVSTLRYPGAPIYAPKGGGVSAGGLPS